MYCKNCGQALMDGARFCTGCGAPVVPDSYPAEGYPIEVAAEEALPQEEYTPAEYAGEYVEEEYAPTEYAGEYVEEEYAPTEYAGEYVEEEYAPTEYAEEAYPPVEYAPEESSSGVYCVNCGTPLEEGMAFCTACGTPVAAPVEEIPVEETPVEEVPVEEVPVEEVPVEEVPVEEIPVEEVPVEEIPADETPTEILQEAAAAEAPAATLCSNCGTPLEDGMAFCVECGTPAAAVAAAIPVAEEPVTGKKAKKEKKPKAEKPQGEKKRLSKEAVIWIIVAAVVVLGAVGGFLGYRYYQMSSTYEAAFAALDNREYDEALALFEKYDYKDSEVMADMLRTQQADYAAALDALDAHEYETAQNIFDNLGDYRDSAEWSEYKVTYVKAGFVQECALNGDVAAGVYALGEGDSASFNEAFAAAYLYARAGDLYTEILDYQDAAVLADDCYYNAGLVYLDEAAWDAALGVMDNMSADAADEFFNEYMDHCADNKALAAVESALNLYNQHPEMDAGYVTGLEENIAALEALSLEYFHDDALLDGILMYTDGLRMERDSMDEDGYMMDEVLFYEACAQQSDAIDILIECGFEVSDESLLYSYEGMGDYYRACAVITDDLHSQLNGQNAEYDGEVGDCLTYTNNTGHTFLLDYHFEFAGEGEYLGSSDQYQLEIPAGETVKIPLNVPNDIAYIWDEWTIWRSFEITDY